MLHKFLGFSTTLLLLLLTALLPMPSLCARSTFGLHQLLHGGRHPLPHEPHSSSNLNIQMVTGQEGAGSSEGALNTLTPPSGHEANMNIPMPGLKANVLSAPTIATDELNVNLMVPTQVPHSMTTFAPLEADVAPVSGSSTGGSSTSTSDRHSMHQASLAKEYIKPSLKRSLLVKHVSATDSNVILQSGKDLSLSLDNLKATKVDNIFVMLPRGRVPPSGPSKSHNSEVTEDPS